MKKMDKIKAKARKWYNIGLSFTDQMVIREDEWLG